MEPSCDGYHCRVVSCELELRQEGCPASLLALLHDAGSESAVCRNASSDGYLLDSGVFGRLDELVHKDIDECLLEAGTDVSLVLLHKVRVKSHLVAHKVKK